MPEIILGGQKLSFTTYKSISSDILTATVGIHNYEIGKTAENILKHGKDVSQLVNSVANERKKYPAVNVFWFEHKNNQDTLFIIIPFDIDEKTKVAVVALKTDSKTRETILQLMTSVGVTQEQLKDYLVAFLEPSGAHIDQSKINVTNISFMRSRANELVINATRNETQAFNFPFLCSKYRVSFSFTASVCLFISKLGHFTLTTKSPNCGFVISTL